MESTKPYSGFQKELTNGHRGTSTKLLPGTHTQRMPHSAHSQCPRKCTEADTHHPGPSLDRVHTGPEAGEEVTALKTGKTDSIFNLRDLLQVVHCRTIFIIWKFTWSKPTWLLEGNDGVMTSTYVRHPLLWMEP